MTGYGEEQRVGRRAVLGGAAAIGAAALTGFGTSTRASAAVNTATMTPERASASAPIPRYAGTVATGLHTPWGFTFTRSGIAIVGERDTGRVFALNPGNHAVRTMGYVRGILHTPDGEGGLLGLALSPSDPTALFAYATTKYDNRVVRIDIAGGRIGKVTPVLIGLPHNTHHNGGALLFDGSGALLVSVGDAGNSATAQNRTDLSGKILRIDPRTGQGATGNPFRNRVWTYGHRNIEGMAFNGRGHLWATEFGQNTSDELNLITRGQNYGWPLVEGRGSRFTQPKVTWSPTSTCSPSGIAIIRSVAFIGALQGQCIYRVPIAGTAAGPSGKYYGGTFGRVRRAVAAPDGSLWMTTSNTDGRGHPHSGDDKILRFVL